MKKQQRRSIYAVIVYLVFIAELVATLFPCCRLIAVPVPNGFFAVERPVNIPDAFNGVFNLMGTIGLFLGFINAARLRRVKGILIDDVMGLFYPYYGVLFIFHALFTGVGFYASHTEDIGAISRCLFVLVACLVFESIMVYRISFSEFHTKKMTTRYIEDRVHQFRSKGCSTLDLEADCFQIARHIRSQFASHQITFPLTVSGSGNVNDFLAVDIFLLFSFLGQKNKDKPCRGDMKQRFLDRFSSNLRDATSSQNDIEQCIYNAFCMPGYWDALFPCGEIVKCGNIWGELLSLITEPLVRAEVILNIFIIELSPKRVEKFARGISGPYSEEALCCGLVFHLCDNNINSNPEEWISCSRLLLRVYQLGESIYSSPHVSDRSLPEKEALLGLIREAGLIFLSLCALISYYSGPIPLRYNPGAILGSMYEGSGSLLRGDCAKIAFCYADSIAAELKVPGYPREKDAIKQSLLLEKAEEILNDMLCS